MGDTLLKDGHGNVYSMDNLGTQKWLDGHYSGLDQCCLWLEEKATALFAQRKREQAIELQNLADEMRKELKPEMVKRAQEHRAQHPAELERAKWGAV